MKLYALIVYAGMLFFSLSAYASPLHDAIGKNDYEKVTLLLEKGADVNEIGGYFHNTPLHYAARFGKIEIVRLLLSKGALVNKADRDGNIPLHEACIEADIDIVRLLVEKGSSLDLKNKFGTTPLYNAEMYYHYRVATYLRGKGARLTNSEIADINRQHRIQRYEQRFTAAAFTVPLVYLGTSIYFREYYYEDTPENNRMGSFNAMLTGAVLGGISLGFIGGAIGSLFDKPDFNPYNFENLVWGAFIGGIVGTVTGIIAGYHYRNVFKNNRGLYYTAPTVSVIIPFFSCHF